MKLLECYDNLSSGLRISFIEGEKLNLSDEPAIGKYVKAQSGCRMLAFVFLVVLLVGQGTSPTVAIAVNVPPPPKPKQTKPTGKELAGLKTTPPHVQTPSSSVPSPATKDQRLNSPATKDQGLNSPATKGQGLNSPGTKEQGLKSLPSVLHGPNRQELHNTIHQIDVLTTPVPTP